MAIEINKEKSELKYYYSENGSTLGPFNLSQLLEKIDADTLVYREGIDWTNAKDVEELKKFFRSQQQQPVNNKVNAEAPSSTVVDTQPKNMFRAPFSFNGRIRRMEYGISIIIYLIAYSLIVGMSLSSVIFLVAFVPLIWFLWAQGAKRCHDRGNSGWYQIIPFYALWMLFAEGDKNENEYGNSPK